MNNMLRNVLSELVQLGDEVLGVIYDLLKKLRADKDGVLLAGLKKLLRGGMVAEVVSYIVCSVTVLVDETLTIEEAVKAGKFDWSNENITSSKFPKIKSGKKEKRETSVFHFKKTMTSDGVIAEMEKAGFKPATIWDLLALAVEKPDMQREFPIAALGSDCELGGYRHVAYLCGGPAGRGLNLDCFGGGWFGSYRFLGVRK